MCLLSQRRRRAKGQAGCVDYFLEVPLVPFVGPVMKKAVGQRSEQAFMEQDEHSCDVYAFFGMRSQDFLRNTGLFEDISKKVHNIFGV